MKIRSLWVALAIASLTLVGQSSALAKGQCFSVFSGAATVEFDSPVTSSKPLTGRIFGGGLSSCAGLSAWPVFGSSFKDASGDIEVAFRAMTVDTTNCGAVDWIVTLSGNPLSGDGQFVNDRHDSGNTTTVTQVACPKPLPADKSGLQSHAGVDAQGNF